MKNKKTNIQTNILGRHCPSPRYPRPFMYHNNKDLLPWRWLPYCERIVSVMVQLLATVSSTIVLALLVRLLTTSTLGLCNSTSELHRKISCLPSLAASSWNKNLDTIQFQLVTHRFLLSIPWVTIFLWLQAQHTGFRQPEFCLLTCEWSPNFPGASRAGTNRSLVCHSIPWTQQGFVCSPDQWGDDPLSKFLTERHTTEVKGDMMSQTYPGVHPA